MEKLTYRFSLDVNKNGIQRTIQGIETGDKYAREVRITLRNGKEDYEFPSDDTIVASMYVKKPNSSTPSINTCTIEGNEIVYTLKNTDVNVMGTTIMQVKLVGTLRGGAEAVLVAPRFALEVWESETDDSEAEESTIYGSLENALAEAEAYYDERITGVTIEEDYTIKVTFADSTKTYTSDCLKTFHNEITSATSELTSTENRLTSQVTSLGNSLTSLATSETTKLDSQFASTSAKINSQVASTSSALTSEVASYGTSLSTAFTSESSAIASQFASESNAITSLFTSESNAIVSLFTSESNKIASQFASESAVLSSEVTSLGNKIDSESVTTSTAISEVSSAFTSEITSMGSKIDSESTAFTSELTSTATYLESEIATKVNSASPSTSGTFTHTGNFTASGIIRSNMGIFADSIGGDTVYANNITANTTGGDITVDSNLILEQGLELDGLDLSNTLTALGSDITRNANDIADLKNKPSSALVLTSSSPLATSSASNILGIECEGKSEQHLSKNLLNVTMRSGTTGGINYTVNDDKSITLGGTRTAASSRSIGTVELKSGDTVTFSASGTYSGVTLVLRKPSGTTISTSSIPQTRTVDSDGLWGFELKGTGDGVEASGTMYCQVEKGSEATSYEPYTGTPTPTNPIAIVDASGVVVAHTINLCEKKLSGYNLDGNGKIVASGTYDTAIAKVEKDKTYTLTYASNQDSLSVVYGFFTSEPIVGSTSYNASRTMGGSNTVTSPIDGWIAVRCELNFAKVQIEQGTTASDYVPYASNSIYINNCEAQASWVIGSAWDNGSVVGSGIWGRTEKLTIVNNSIHVVCDASMYRLRCSFWNGETYLSQITENDKSEATFTVPTNATHYALSIVKASGTSMTTEYTNMVHIKVVGIINDCLRSIGTVADTLVVKEDGSGVLTKRVGTVDLGTLTWNSASNYYHSSGIADKIRQSTSTSEMPNMICTTLSANTRSATTVKGTNFITVYANGNIVATPTDTPIGTLYYELATPIVTTLTASQVASILALRTYNGTTIVDSEIVKDVTYSADVKGYVDSKCDYSYSDTIIGKWADGKDLHRMVISATTPSSANTSALVSDAINSDMCNLKDIKGTVDTGGGTIVSINSWFSSNNYVGTFLSTEGIKMKVGGYTSKPCEIIVEYTLNEESAIATLSEVSE